VLGGRIVVHGTAEPIEAAFDRRERRDAPPGRDQDDRQRVVIGDLPEAVLTVSAAAYGFTQRTFRVPVSADGEELVIELREPTEGAEKVVIHGVTVTIAEEVELTLGSGEELSITEYIDHAGEQIRTAAGTVGTLAELWRDPDKRRLLREKLSSHDLDAGVLSVLLARPDADEFDLLAHAGSSRRSTAARSAPGQSSSPAASSWRASSPNSERSLRHCWTSTAWPGSTRSPPQRSSLRRRSRRSSAPHRQAARAVRRSRRPGDDAARSANSPVPAGSMTLKDLQAKIKSASDKVRADDNTKNALKYLEQLTWLLFLRQWDTIEDEREMIA
jgi:hypothetical protein